LNWDFALSVGVGVVVQFFLPYVISTEPWPWFSYKDRFIIWFL